MSQALIENLELKNNNVISFRESHAIDRFTMVYLVTAKSKEDTLAELDNAGVNIHGADDDWFAQPIGKSDIKYSKMLDRFIVRYNWQYDC
ncbi:hypothetical protein ACP3V3_16720 [Vibrio sp. PNB22_3_1]